MTTTGFGDIAPVTFNEYIVTIIWMFIGAGFYSLRIANLNGIL